MNGVIRFLGLMSISALAISAAPVVQIEINHPPGQMEFSWKPPPEGLPSAVELLVERSADLSHWEPTSIRNVLRKGRSDTWRTAVLGDENHFFYRLRSDFGVQLLSAQGEDILGYGPAFVDQLRAIGQISVEDFERRYTPQFDYVTQLSWDPTTAQYFTEFNSPPTPKTNYSNVTYFRSGR